MRTLLLATVALTALGFATPTLAQSPPAAPAANAVPVAPAAPVAAVPPAAPMSAPAAAPAGDSSAAAPAPDATPADAATPAAEATPPAKHHHHHKARAKAKAEAAGDDAGARSAHEPGTGESGPASKRASNIDAGDSHSDIAPHLPTPAAGLDGSAEAYLTDAKAALAKKQSGAAQQALEMAETRLLDRSTPVDQASTPDQTPEITSVTEARDALGKGDMKAAAQAIDAALAAAPK